MLIFAWKVCECNKNFRGSTKQSHDLQIHFRCWNFSWEKGLVINYNYFGTWHTVQVLNIIHYNITTEAMVIVDLSYNIFWKNNEIYDRSSDVASVETRSHCNRSLEPIFSTQTISNKRLTYWDDWFLNASYTRTWAILQPLFVSRAIFLPRSVSKKKPRLSITINRVDLSRLKFAVTSQQRNRACHLHAAILSTINHSPPDNEAKEKQRGNA